MEGTGARVKDDVAPEAAVPPRGRRRLRGGVAAASAGLVAAMLAGLWLARVPIATGLIDRQLGGSGVAVRYRLADLGLGRQRLTDVVIGDPARPDLVADWVETTTEYGLAGPRLAGVRAGRVRLRARLADGRLSLGALDRLLPAGTPGQPFALPALDVAVRDGRVRLETPWGVIGARLAGGGRLDGGFRGTLAAVSERLAIGGCTLAHPTAFVTLAVRGDGPQVTGPVRAAAARCGTVAVRDAAATLDARLGRALDRWSGRVALRAATVAGGDGSDGGGIGHVAALTGTADFTGTARGTAGHADLAGGAFVAPGVTGERLAFRGAWRFDGARASVAGEARAAGAALDRAARAGLAAYATTGTGTPIAPLAGALARAATRAAGRFDGTAALALDGDGRVTIARAAATAASGARLRFGGDGAGVTIGDPGGLRVDGVATLAGGGFPAIRVALERRAAGGAVRGVATIAPYAAGGARIVLAPIAFAVAARHASIRTGLTLSGPLADGRVERLRMPLTVTRDGDAVAVNPACAPLAFDRLTIGGLALRPARLAICPLGGALARARGGRLDYGARIAGPRLAGVLGASPVTVGADSLALRDGAITAAGLRARLGAGDSRTALDIARLAGTVDAGGIAGTFAGGAGRIANVPLLLGDAGGRWRFAGGVLAVTGALSVADAAPSARFLPLAGRDVTLRLADGAITAAGTLLNPAKGVKVADVTIRHALGPGTGAAHLAVPGITFGAALQPEQLTPLTFGVIADVQGVVRGAGDIAWSPGGVTSTGLFRTDGIDLAAAFGPVSGLKGEIRFTDLLAMESAPGQVATIASINPGVAVNDGRVVYRTLPGNRVQIEGARWPFAGGELTLDPTLLDFDAARERRLSFRVKGMEAGQFLQQFDFKNLDATGVFDGVLPMVFDQSGGRIENGRLGVRPGGGGIAYVGALTERDLGTWGNMAFQALKSLRYGNLDIIMNGPLSGEMITEVRFAGISQGQGAQSNFVIRRLQRLPFVFNVRIAAPFRGLVDSVASFYDPKRLIQRNLPALLEEQQKRTAPHGVQPPASETRP